MAKFSSIVVIAILYAALSVGAVSVLVFHLQPTLSTPNNGNNTPTVNILLYGGELANGQMGFGYSPSNLTSPGPTLRFKLTDLVSITVINTGKISHAFAIVDTPRTGANVLFQAQVGSTTSPLSPGQQGTIIFRPNLAAATFYYICPLSGHAEAGMWGSVIVTGS